MKGYFINKYMDIHSHRINACEPVTLILIIIIIACILRNPLLLKGKGLGFLYQERDKILNKLCGLRYGSPIHPYITFNLDSLVNISGIKGIKDRFLSWKMRESRIKRTSRKTFGKKATSKQRKKQQKQHADWEKDKHKQKRRRKRRGAGIETMKKSKIIMEAKKQLNIKTKKMTIKEYVKVNKMIYNLRRKSKIEKMVKKTYNTRSRSKNLT